MEMAAQMTWYFKLSCLNLLQDDTPDLLWKQLILCGLNDLLLNYQSVTYQDKPAQTRLSPVDGEAEGGVGEDPVLLKGAGTAAVAAKAGVGRIEAELN